MIVDGKDVVKRPDAIRYELQRGHCRKCVFDSTTISDCANGGRLRSKCVTTKGSKSEIFILNTPEHIAEYTAWLTKVRMGLIGEDDDD